MEDKILAEIRAMTYDDSIPIEDLLTNISNLVTKRRKECISQSRKNNTIISFLKNRGVTSIGGILMDAIINSEHILNRVNNSFLIVYNESYAALYPAGAGISLDQDAPSFPKNKYVDKDIVEVRNGFLFMYLNNRYIIFSNPSQTIIRDKYIGTSNTTNAGVFADGIPQEFRIWIDSFKQQ